MKILIACEFSGIVRNAFIKKGHQAVSCDLMDTESDGPHYLGDVMDIIDEGWDMMIAFPPCTHLTVTANRHFLNNPDRWYKRLLAVKFVYDLLNCNIPKIAIENPKGVLSTYIGKPAQYIQPYEYGHKRSKKTGLWLKGLKNLIPENIVEPEYIIASNGKRYSPDHWNTSSTNNKANAMKRSRTYQGIAAAMANQWG